MPDDVIRKGSRVTLHFCLSLAGGRVVDSTGDADPMTLTIGEGVMADGLEKYLVGLTVGDRKQLEIPAGEIYGLPDPSAIQRISRGDFPPDIDPQPGQVLGFTSPTGEEVPAVVLSVDADSVEVDFSHPLAGHDLVFVVEILAVIPALDGPRS